MNEHEIRLIRTANPGSAARSHLLTPIIEGTPEGQDNLDSFLTGRLIIEAKDGAATQRERH
jgi:hypothetical protein